MAADHASTRKTNTQILQEHEPLREPLSQPLMRTTTRRTASLSLPRIAMPPISFADETAVDKDEATLNPKPRSRRMSLSPRPSRPKLNSEENQRNDASAQQEGKSKWADEPSASSGKKGFWNWKPIRALTRLGMQKLTCLFSVEVVTVRGLPASMNGLRLSVCVRKKGSKDGSVQTMPSRISQGAADFEETLFIRCHVYFIPGGGTRMKFEPRPFLIYLLAVDAGELDFGRSSVDLSGLIQESIERSFEGSRIRQWDRTFGLSGKAKGGELVLKLGFQIMEKDGGIWIYSQAETQGTDVAQKQSKSSFSIPSRRMSGQAEAWKSPSLKGVGPDVQGIDDLNLDEPASHPTMSPPLQKPEANMDENDLPEFDVVDKGVEFQDQDGEDDEERSDKRLVLSSEVVKEVVQDQSHLTLLEKLDSIAQQIKALESNMGQEKGLNRDEETGSQALDAEEDKVTREFLQMLEDPENKRIKIGSNDKVRKKLEEDKDEEEVYVPDLGKGLGCVVQTRYGGYLVAANPLETTVARKDTPKLAIQMSKPLVIQSTKAGIVLFQKVAAIGFEELNLEITSSMPLDELMGKTAERIAFEGIASAIVQGRNKEGASSSAARIIAAVKSMATAINSGRMERISTGIWSVGEDPLTVDEILAFSMHKIETMAIEALKIQADIYEEDAPFDVSPLDPKTTAANGKVCSHPLASAIPIEDWIKANTPNSCDPSLESETITISVAVQLHDPMRHYEPVGGPMITLIHATGVANRPDIHSEEKRYKVAGVQVGGVKVRTPRTNNVWGTEKQKLTALQWLVAYGMGKSAKRRKVLVPNGPDLLWSISSGVMTDTWLKPIRNPDVKFPK